MRSAFLCCLATLALAGCASIGVRDDSLQVQVTPQPLLRGKPALAKVNAPLAAEKVTGTVLVMGSPELEFRKDDKEKIWYFYGTIPFSPWVKPGDYKVRVVVETPNDRPRYTELKVTLQ
jgi:hypothetical protein